MKIRLLVFSMLFHAILILDKTTNAINSPLLPLSTTSTAPTSTAPTAPTTTAPTTTAPTTTAPTTTAPPTTAPTTTAPTTTAPTTTAPPTTAPPTTAPTTTAPTTTTPTTTTPTTTAPTTTAPTTTAPTTTTPTTTAPTTTAPTTTAPRTTAPTTTAQTTTAPTTTAPTTTVPTTTAPTTTAPTTTAILTTAPTTTAPTSTIIQTKNKNIVSTTTKSPVQGPHYHPIYRYSCNEDLSVTFKGVNGIIEYFPATDKTDSCTIEQISGHNGNFKISKECLSSMSFKDNRWMQVAVYDKNEGETLPTSTPTTTTNNDTTTNTPKTRTSPQLITGHHIFNLTCLPLKEEGVDRIALAETGIIDIEQLHNVYNEIGQVEMRFKEGESLNKPDLSEVYIGDRFYMYLKYMGETDDYIIVPQTCTAYKGTFRTNIGEKLELWKQSTTNGGDCRTTDAKQYKVMENFKRLSKTIVHAELHGFRFSSELTGEFDDVTISCTVKVCTSEGGKCEDNCKINGNRRRRGIDKTADNMYKAKRSTGRIRSQTVFQTIKVGKRGFKSNNGGKNGVHGGTVAILVVAGIVFWKAFH